MRKRFRGSRGGGAWERSALDTAPKGMGGGNCAEDVAVAATAADAAGCGGMAAEAVNGPPSAEDGLPAFRWDVGPFASAAHRGMPRSFHFSWEPQEP